MIISMNKNATEAEIGAVLRKIKELGFEPHYDKGSEIPIIGIRGNTQKLEEGRFFLPGVEKVSRVSKIYKEVSREFQPWDSVIDINGVKVGGTCRPAIIAGPCAVESRDQLLRIAEAVKEAGADMLRGGAFKPRSSPYAFQGLKEQGLEYLAEARGTFGLPIVTEIKGVEAIELFEKYDIDVYQVGARNMQNFDLLEKLGHVKKPVLLKRGEAKSIDELLLSAEYIAASGNKRIILCERGIVPHKDSKTRYTFDVSAFCIVRELSHLPIIGDPSHASGHWKYVAPLSKAAIAAGAQGLMIEVHHEPENALCDGGQSLKPDKFRELMAEISLLIGR